MTEIKLVHTKGSGGWMIKKQVESFKFDFIIEAVSIREQVSLDIRKNAFIKMCFNTKNIEVFKEILSVDEVNLLQKVLLDNKDFDSIGNESGKSKEEISDLWISANNRLKTRIQNFTELVKKNERLKLEKELEDKILDCKYYVQDAHKKIEKKVKYYNILIADAMDKIKIKKVKPEILIPEITELRREEVLKMRLSGLELTERAKNILHYADILTINDLLKITPNDLMRYRNVGAISVLEIRTVINKLGIPWG